MTLIEVVCAITIIAVIAAVVLPVLSSATDAYANASSARTAVESVAYAVEKSVRLFRDVPPGSTDGTVGIAAASANSVLFTDGRGLEMSGTTLLLRTSPTVTAPLCRNVSVFQVTYLSKDGVTNVQATPTQAQRFNIRLAAAGVELRSSAFARVEMSP